MPRRIRPELFCRKGVLKDFARFHRKTPVLEFLFDCRPQTSIPFFTEHLWWLLLYIFVSSYILKKFNQSHFHNTCCLLLLHILNLHVKYLHSYEQRLRYLFQHLTIVLFLFNKSTVSLYPWNYLKLPQNSGSSF